MNLLSKELSARLMRSAESVTHGHPDKVCDQCADALVDLVLPGGRNARMAAEVTGGHKEMYVTGECKSTHSLEEFNTLAHATLARVYDEVTGSDLREIKTNMVQQSVEIAQGVDPGGAGDQGCMVGFATRETPEMLPRPFRDARLLSQAMYRAALDKTIPWMRTDGKTQVVWRGDELLRVVIAIQHIEDVSDEQIKRDLLDKIILPCLGREPKFLTPNGAGRWTIGGFDADAGTTGRKIVVDAYGPEVAVGGGAYSGKDPTKVDRSAAYMARYIAKNCVHHHNADSVLVQLAYTIGLHQPDAVIAITNDGRDLSDWVRARFDLSPNAIIDKLDLWRPIYREVNVGGHYGVDHTNPDNAEKLKTWTWENIDESLA